MSYVRTALWILLLGLLAGSSAARAQFTLYVSTFTNNAIYQYDATGQPSPFADGLHGPAGLAVDGSGNLFVADIYSSTVHQFLPSGEDEGVFASGLVNPNSVAFDSSGILYVANGGNTFGNNYILRFAPDGSQLPGVRLPDVTALYGLAFDPSGNLYAADRYSNSIHMFSPTGDNLGDFAGGLADPIGLAFDGSGNLYVANYTGNTVSVFDPSGARIGTLASGLRGPAGLAFDPSGNLYVANLDGGTIRVFSPTWDDLGDFATGVPTPWGLAFAAED
jgi:DNA-binding beta-propeller fold protein YncE